MSGQNKEAERYADEDSSRMVLCAQRLVDDGWRWMVGMDLEMFFDQFNHNMRMSRVTR